MELLQENKVWFRSIKTSLRPNSLLVIVSADSSKRFFCRFWLLKLYHWDIPWIVHFISVCQCPANTVNTKTCLFKYTEKKVREKSWECHNHKSQPFPDIKRKRKSTNPNKHKPIKHMKSTKISSLFPKRGNRNAKRTEKHKNKMNKKKWKFSK